MHFASLATAVAAAAAAGVAHALPAASAATVPASSFYLKTAAKSSEKSAFSNLYVYAYHTGAGTADAMLSANKSHAVPANALAGDIPGTAATDDYFSVLFDLGSKSSDGTSVPYALVPAAADTIYAGWEPVAINAGGSGPTNETAFFLDANGALEWTNTAGTSVASSFNGWLVCQWWHSDIDDATQPGVQLFFRENGYGTSTPTSCADVDLVLEYLA